MADPVAAVTDTHPLLFHARNAKRLPRVVAAHFAGCERGTAVTYVPVVVAWEVSLLVRVGKVHLGRSVAAFFDALFSNSAYQPLGLTMEQACLADGARPNDDPFDALIVAAAISLDLPLLTRDQDIQRSGLVNVIW